MVKKQASEYCRSTGFFFLLILILCIAAASAATLNTNLVNTRITTTTTSQIADMVKPADSLRCPVGYDCLTDADAAAQLGSFEKYSDTVCGYKQSTATMAAVVRTPEYCVKKKELTPTMVVCANGCSCISEATAKTRGGTWSRCSADICGYEQGTATLAAAVRVPKYCMNQESTTPACPEGCVCLSDADTKARYGDSTRCSAEICGYDVSAVAGALTATRVPKYCVKPAATTPGCPEGCICISDEDAKLKGLTERCDTSQNSCGYRSADATTTSAAHRVPLSCYKIPATTPVCREGCSCLPEAEATLKFGPGNYTRCQEDTCGYDPSATTANGIPKYCFRPTITPTPSGCPQGCGCTANATAAENGLRFCGGTLTSCGYDESKQPLYCFGEVALPACVYDYQKNVCSGTCQSGAACSVVGKNIDEKTGAAIAVCGCPQQSSCIYDTEKEACAGTCTGTGENCQLNTISRDPATGKVTSAECHCKAGGDILPTCTCDVARGSCSGTCADGKACTMTGHATDNAGKRVCSTCECRDTCVLTANNECSGTCLTGEPCARIVTRDDSGQEKASCGCGGSPAGTPPGVATRQPGIFESIASFFNKLFGGR